MDSFVEANRVCYSEEKEGNIGFPLCTDMVSDNAFLPYNIDLLKKLSVRDDSKIFTDDFESLKKVDINEDP